VRETETTPVERAVSGVEDADVSDEVIPDASEEVPPPPPSPHALSRKKGKPNMKSPNKNLSLIDRIESSRQIIDALEFYDPTKDIRSSLWSHPFIDL